MKHVGSILPALALALAAAALSCGGPDSRGEGVGAAPASSLAGAHTWVTGVYVGYQRDLYPPEAIAWEALTHLTIGAVNPRADGSLDTSFFLDPTSGPALAKRLVVLAHQHGKKALIMLGGAGQHDAWVGAASEARLAGCRPVLSHKGTAGRATPDSGPTLAKAGQPPPSRP